MTATSAPQPIKADHNGMQPLPMGAQGAPMNFEGAWDGESYMFPPVLDQFPDYDWAASFDFSNDPTQMQMPIPMPPVPQAVDMGPMSSGPGGYQYG